MTVADTRTAEQLRTAVCGTKARFGSRKAREAAERIRAGGEHLSPYRCPFCSWWHIGHPPSMDTVARLARIIRGLD